MNIRKLPLLLAFSFSILSFAAIFTPQPTYAVSASERCEKRLKIINDRGKKMAKKSKTIQTKYKTANKGWKEKIKVNKKFATKYAEDDRLQGKTDVLNKEVKEFQQAVKAYNAAKKPYIEERNAQTKSYKTFKANCATGDGRVKTLDKMRARNQDMPRLAAKSKAVSDVYKSKVKVGILDMRKARTDILTAKKGLKEVEKASQSKIDGSVSGEDTDVDEGVDDLFDQADLDDPDNEGV